MSPERTGSTARVVAFGQVLLGQDPTWAALIPDETVALGRRWLQATQGPFATLVSLTNHGWFRTLSRWIEPMTILGLFLYQTLRKAHIECRVRSLLDRGARQAVIVGGGYDTLAVRLSTSYPDVRFLEVDTAAMQRRKQQELDADEQGVQFVPANLETRALNGVLTRLAFFRVDTKTVFIV